MQVLPKERGSWRGVLIAAWLVFLLSGLLIMWTPLWALCFPLWGAPPVLGLMGLSGLLRTFRANRQAALARLGWIGASVLVFVAHMPLAGNYLWLRYGVELRLLRAGGTKGLESWVDSYVDARQAEWDRLGGRDGLAKLDSTSRTHFSFVPATDMPEPLQPLARYLPLHLLIQDRDGRPVGLSFALAGWDHGWGLKVFRDTPPDGERRPWPCRLSTRSDLWGQP